MASNEKPSTTIGDLLAKLEPAPKIRPETLLVELDDLVRSLPTVDEIVHTRTLRDSSV